MTVSTTTKMVDTIIAVLLDLINPKHLKKLVYQLPDKPPGNIRKRAVTDLDNAECPASTIISDVNSTKTS
jgi:hypothetical protein